MKKACQCPLGAKTPEEQSKYPKEKRMAGNKAQPQRLTMSTRRTPIQIRRVTQSGKQVSIDNNNARRRITVEPYSPPQPLSDKNKPQKWHEDVIAEIFGQYYQEVGDMKGR